MSKAKKTVNQNSAKDVDSLTPEENDNQKDIALDPTSIEDEAASDGATAEQEEEIPIEEPSKETLLEDRLVRLQADFDNFRKRTLREREDLYRRANEDIISELLPVLDHLELALQATGGDTKDHPLVKGFALVGEQLQKTLHKFGLAEVPTEEVEFDPNVHEAIQHLPSETIPENGIVARTRAGYMLGNRLLRAAQVVVSSGAQDLADDA